MKMESALSGASSSNATALENAYPHTKAEPHTSRRSQRSIARRFETTALENALL